MDRPDRRATAHERRVRRGAVRDPAVVMEAAAAFLAARSRSISETRRRLHHLGYAEGVTEEVIGRLTRLGYLDDHAFARAWVESRDRSRPRGQAALRLELGRRGVDPAVVREVLAERAAGSAAAGGLDGPSAAVAHRVGGPARTATESPERAAAVRLLARRASALERETDPRRRRQKAYALLARNGFDPDVCREVTQGADAPTGEDDR